MCLIAYSPHGELMPYEVFKQAAFDNPDGIGVMSAYAVKKFVGSDRKIRAWALIKRLSEESIPYGIHFRWRTHGPINASLCHPFKATDGNTYIMHNGVIGATGAYAEKHESDTSVFVRDFVDLSGMNADAYAAEIKELETFIGWGNKLLVLDMPSGAFTIANEIAGDWLEGLWYSNTWSHPANLLPTKYAAWQDYPARFLTDYPVDSATPTRKLIGKLKYSGLLTKEPMAPIDNEESYYRTLCQSAGYYDDGNDSEDSYPLPMADDVLDDDDYKALLRVAAANGRGR